MKFNQLLESVLTEASGLSTTGLSKQAVKAFHNKFNNNKNVVSRLKHDTDFKSIPNKKELKLQMVKANQYNDLPMTVAVNNKTKQDIIVRALNKDTYQVYRYDRNSGEIEDFPNMSLTKALAVIGTGAKLYMDTDSNVDRAKQIERDSYKREIRDINDLSRNIDKHAEMKKYTKLFAAELTKHAQYYIDLYSDYIMREPLKSQYSSDTAESNGNYIAQKLQSVAKNWQSNVGTDQVHGLLKYLHTYKPDQLPEWDYNKERTAEEFSKDVKKMIAGLLTVVKKPGIFDDLANYNARDLFKSTSLY